MKKEDLEKMTEKEVWKTLEDTIENCSNKEDVNKIGEITRYAMDKGFVEKDVWDYIPIAINLSKEYFPHAYKDSKNVTRIKKSELNNYKTGELKI